MREFDELVKIMAALRGEKGCPWDREQDHRTLMPYFLEETREALEAIEAGDMASLCEELGDVMLQIVFHSQIAREAREFTIEEVISGISRKLVRRHPHVFGESTVTSSQDVVRQWNEIKEDEKKKKGGAARRSPDKEGKKAHSLEKNLSALEEELKALRRDLRDSPGTEKRLARILYYAVEAAGCAGIEAEHALRAPADSSGDLQKGE
ncbi:MAG: MazG family protein [Candidatus Eremiobacteraeota bacterium]|nr:MazG family protein [Candidatus Eremiobacteraeota bacterium]